MNIFKLILILFISSFALNSQVIKLEKAEVQNYPNLHSKFKQFQVVNISSDYFYQQTARNTTVSKICLKGLEIDEELSLIEYDLFKSDFKRLEGIDKNKTITTQDRAGIRTFKVVQKHSPNQYSALTLAPGFIYGYFNSKSRRIYIEPLSYYEASASKDQFVLYNESDVIPIKEIRCGADEIESNHSLHVDSKENTNRAGCITVDVALAADKTIHDNKGGVNNSEAFMIGVLNNVQTNYDDEFAVAIEFSVSALFVATTNAGDPWNNVFNINTHLDVHRNWANGGGYGGAPYGVATAWSRKYTSGAIGVAWLNAICSGIRYNVCSDFGGSAGLLRCLQAHELGHNFNCIHDAAGSGFIMAPAVNNSNSWSSNSINAVNSIVPGLGCVGICNGGEPPIAEFEGNPLSFCPNQMVKFSDMSFGFPNKWTWSFPGGTPTSSNQQHPSIIYKSSGEYDVTLTISNAFGNSSVTKKMYVEVLPSVVNSFLAYTIGNKLITVNSSKDVDTYLWKFGDGSTSVEDEPTYTYPKDGTYTVEFCGTNSCGTICKTTKVIAITPVVSSFKAEQQSGCSSLAVKFRNLSSSNATTFNWTFPGGTPASSTEKEPLIIYNAKGKYNVSLKAGNSKYDSSITKQEFILVESKPGTDFEYKLETPNKIIFSNLTDESFLAVKNKYLWKFDDGSTSSDQNPIHIYKAPGKYNVCLSTENSCGIISLCKEVEVPNALIPSFDASEKEVCLPHDIGFINNSFGASSFLWRFEGAQPTVSIEEHPKVSYAKSGKYEVSLTIYNASDSNVLVKKDFINVKSPVQCPNRKGKSHGAEERESEETEIVTERSRQSSQIQLFPNPNNGRFIIECPDSEKLSELKILNLHGKEVGSKLLAKGKTQIILSLDNNNFGMHYIFFKYNGIQQINRLIITH